MALVKHNTGPRTHYFEQGGDAVSLCGHITMALVVSALNETPKLCTMCERIRLIVQREALAEAVEIFKREEAARDIHSRE